ncbi:hypothetical protein [Muricoccus aerilatus]|nr:hypothetical protein [Roseomonas aerilata]
MQHDPCIHVPGAEAVRREGIIDDRPATKWKGTSADIGAQA